MRRFICIGIAGLISLAACKKSSVDNGNNNSGGNTGSGTTTLAITDFSPKTGQSGTTITITGTGFGSDLTKVKVSIGASPYDLPISVTPTTMVVKTNLGTPSGKIRIIVNGVQVNSAADFTALAEDLKITGFTGSAGQVGSSQLGHQMYLTASGLYDSGGVPLAMKDTNKVFFTFAGTTTPVKANWLFNGLTAGTVVPRNAQAGKVTLTVNGKSVISDINFNLDMSMHDFTPKTFSYGDTIKITGVGFTTISDMGIRFAAGSCCEVFARPISVTPTQMLVIVPHNSTITSSYLSISSSLILAGSGYENDTSPDKYTIKK